ncbi:hypothetical protein Ahy_A05g021912 isoform B [Arachis hypogaea]|uniref:Uncharacterized protein n=1 Tax=Arachis hypogaea TaxID=3818 RepID=A0A445CYS6_ARAHY|nr:hypothetical protein Ahy_A05g021912 isoform B [Arachis hypogaea]
MYRTISSFGSFFFSSPPFFSSFLPSSFFSSLAGPTETISTWHSFLSFPTTVTGSASPIIVIFRSPSPPPPPPTTFLLTSVFNHSDRFTPLLLSMPFPQSGRVYLNRSVTAACRYFISLVELLAFSGWASARAVGS